MVEKIPLEKETHDKWTEFSDGHYRSKKVARYIVELYYGTDRGGQIYIWEPGYESLEHVWPPSDDKKYHMANEINFMDWHNAIDEYRDLNTSKDVINLMHRNM